MYVFQNRDGLLSPLKTETGGLSGRPLFGLSTRVLAKVFVLTNGAIPLVGAGGISDAETAWTKLTAGATLLQLYSALVYQGPALVEAILRGLSQRLSRDNSSLSGIRGTAAADIAHHGFSGT